MFMKRNNLDETPKRIVYIFLDETQTEFIEFIEHDDAVPEHMFAFGRSPCLLLQP